MATTTICAYCGSIGFNRSDDGFYYCQNCGSQAQHMMEFDYGEFEGAVGPGYHVAREHNVLRRQQEDELRKLQEEKKTPIDDFDLDAEFDLEASQARQERLQQILSQPTKTEENDQVRSQLAAQYASVENVHVFAGSEQPYDESELLAKLSDHVREFYLDGLQSILQLQFETAVKELGVSRLICSVAGPVWVQFLGSSHVYDDEWAEEALLLADDEYITQNGGKSDEEKRLKKRQLENNVPLTKAGLRVTSVWTDSLKRRIPLSSTLSVLFLACHIAREAILPSDIIAWATQGVLPYVTAFLKIQPRKFHGPDMRVMPVRELDVKSLFRPIYVPNPRMVEMVAAHIANRVGLELPPVNVQLLADRFVEQLGLPAEPLLTHLQRLLEWFMPEGLWICGRGKGNPSRAYVMAMLIITLKLLYKLEGHAQSSLYWPAVRARLKPSRPVPSRFQPVLDSIEKKLLEDSRASEELLPDYLKYCQDVVYPATNLSVDEALLSDHLWQHFEKSLEKQESTVQVEQNEQKEQPGPSESRRTQQQSESMDYTLGSAAWSRAPAGHRASEASPSVQAAEGGGEAAAGAGLEAWSCNLENNAELLLRLRLAKSMSHEMKRCGFRLAPATRFTQGDAYLSYAVQRQSRKWRKVVHGDYFILLFACARVTSVKVSTLHSVVQLLEEALARLEARVAEVQAQGQSTVLSTGPDGEAAVNGEV